MKHTKAIIFITFVAAISLILHFVFIHPRIFPPKPPVPIKREIYKYKVRGIDVSHHQGSIDWSKVKQHGVDFVFLKATEGEYHVDTRFADNLREAREHKIPVGAYHYYRFNRSALVQFVNYRKVVPRDMIDLPPVIDVEYHSNEALKDRSNKSRFLQELKTLQSLIEKHYGKKPIIYTDGRFYEDLLEGTVTDRFWRSDVRSVNLGYLDSSQWIFWQYSMRGKIPGIPSEVDLNVFNGDLQKLLHL